MTRLYCPLTTDDVETLAAGALGVTGAYAVTPDVRALAPDGDDELHEHLATQFAAASVTGPRVVVAAVDVPGERVRADDGAPVPGRVTLDGDITVRDVACFLVGDEGAQVSEDADLELSWYAASEIDAVRALV